MIRLLLADDHVLVRQGIRSLLQMEPDFQVAGEVADGRSAVEYCQTYQPDVVLMDLGMPGMSGLQATRRIRELQLATQVLMVTVYNQEEYVLHALGAGARGYVLKETGFEELRKAVFAVHAGRLFLGTGLSPELLRDYQQRTAPALPIERLSPRQCEILQLLAEGRAVKEIAFELGLSAKTVETHRAELMRRLNIRDLAGLVRFAIRSGLSPE
jgi:DNA-binding NarL/FixJ family response regulator